MKSSLETSAGLESTLASSDALLRTTATAYKGASRQHIVKPRIGESINIDNTITTDPEKPMLVMVCHREDEDGRIYILSS